MDGIGPLKMALDLLAAYFPLPSLLIGEWYAR